MDPMSDSNNPYGQDDGLAVALQHKMVPCSQCGAPVEVAFFAPVPPEKWPAEFETLRQQLEEARGHAASLRREAGFEESWVFPWEQEKRS